MLLQRRVLRLDCLPDLAAPGDRKLVRRRVFDAGALTLSSFAIMAPEKELEAVKNLLTAFFDNNYFLTAISNYNL